MRLNCILIVILLTCSLLFAAEKGWPELPGFETDSDFTLNDSDTFFTVVGAAALSYILADVVFKNEENMLYYQGRIGMTRENEWDYLTTYRQNLGAENRLANWFTAAVEFNIQEWYDDTPGMNDSDRFGIGMGVTTYYRWYVLGKLPVSPFIEYGTGVFYGLKKFPDNGTNFTFNLSSQLGLEFTFKSKNKLRLSYGQFHQSNNGWLDPNPGYEGNGFSLVYSWYWTEMKGYK